MKIYILVILSVIALINSCKKTQENHVKNKTITPNNITAKKSLSNINITEFTLDPKTKDAIKDWQEYHQLEDIINQVKKSDLTYFDKTSSSIKTLLKDLAINIPDEVNSKATRSRILALKTKAYKLESFSNLQSANKEDLKATAQEFIKSFSNLNVQMNKKLEKENNTILKP